MKKQIVFVGLSGGVDSAVSASLLQRAGYDVVGVFIKTWHPDFLECNEGEERRDAMRVAVYLDIPFLTFGLEKVYKKEVADYMIREYRAGRTPNPDVMCNKEVKFGAFLKKAVSMGADFVATGHYASIRKLSPTVSLLKGKDSSKDQSYFLWTLAQTQLNKTLFPIGHLRKPEVRKLAKKFGLPVAEKKDSQGICFLGAVDLKEFLKHYIKTKEGKVLDEKGSIIGHHDGVVFYTLGERHGFTITKKTPSDKPHYVVAKDVRRNVLVVSSRRKLSSQDLVQVGLEKTNWISGLPLENKRYTAQIRYHGEFLPVTIKSQKKNTAQILFKKPVQVAPGQSVVLYDEDICIGGGVAK